MSRSTAALALATLTLLAAGSTTATAQAPPPPTPVPCAVELGDQAAIAVNAYAVATPACLEIKKGKTRVVWTSSTEVKLLLVAFKNPPGKNAPDDPACAAAQCVLDRAKHALKQGEFDYSVVVVLQDGTTATVDPKLIIQP